MTRFQYGGTFARALAGKAIGRRAAIAAGIATVLGLAGCGSSAAAATSTSQSAPAPGTQTSGELKPIKIGSASSVNELAESGAIAQKEQFFEDELAKVGYKPEYIGFDLAGPAINEAFASGALDFADYGELPALVGSTNGLPIKIIASTNTYYPAGIGARKGTGISSIEDLAGKKVTAGTGTVEYQYLITALKSAGMTIDDVEHVNATTANALSMVASGSADAIVAIPAILYKNADQGILDVFLTNQQLQSPTSFTFTAHTGILKDHPEVAQAALRALQRAFEFAQQNPDQALQDLARTDIPVQYQEQVYQDRSFSYFDPRIDDIVVGQLENGAQFIHDNNLTKTDVNVQSTFDTSVYDQAIAG